MQAISFQDAAGAKTVALRGSDLSAMLDSTRPPNRTRGYSCIEELKPHSTDPTLHAASRSAELQRGHSGVEWFDNPARHSPLHARFDYVC